MPAAVLAAMNSRVNKPEVPAHWRSWLRRRRRQTSKQRDELAFIEQYGGRISERKGRPRRRMLWSRGDGKVGVPRAAE